METSSRKLLKRLQEDGWIVVRISGDHHILQHPERAHTIVVPHPKKDLPRGLVRLAAVSKVMKTYFAILHKDTDSAVGVAFPDLPGCFSAGDTYEEAIQNAEKALALYAEAETSAGRALPEPSPFDRLYSNRDIRDEAEGAPFVGIPLRRARGQSGIYRHAETGEYVSVSDEKSAAKREDAPVKRQSAKSR